MAGDRVEASWGWDVEAAPEDLWPVLADTARFNEAAALPRYAVTESPRADGSVERIAWAKVGGMSLVWEERPYEWVRGHSFSQERWFKRGPFRRFGPSLTIEPRGTGSRVTYTLRAEPANLFGRLLLRLGFMAKTGALVERLVGEATQFLAGRRATPFDMQAPPLPAGAQERAAGLVARLGDTQPLAPRLAQFILTGPEGDVDRIRPRKLAAAWDRPLREVVELCLAAARIGLLDLRWDLLCPRCRGAKVSVPTLDQVPDGAHCPSCNIDYGRDFARNIEVTFRPPASLRMLGAGGFCLASPMATEHVRVQQILAPGERREIRADLPAGDYRLRTVEAGGEVDVTVDGSGFPEVVLDGEAVRAGPPAPRGRLAIVNLGGIERTAVIESRSWIRDALTAHDVTTMQAFRDLFATEALRPGDEVQIGQIALMFTDLKGSTALYGRIGDAKAYALVRDHYAFLTRTIRQHDGAVVKTIGDAIMAAFSEPRSAVAAGLAIQRDIAAFNAASPTAPLVIKLGLHCGPCIAVTLNDRLDYFGTTVNLAARLQGCSEGDDIVLSREIAQEPSVRPLLDGLALVSEEATLKGFDELLRFFRLRAERA